LALEAVQDPERSKGWIALDMDRLFQPDPGWQDGSLPQERLVDDERFFSGPTEDDRGVGFADPMLSDHQAQLSGCLSRLRDKNEAAGFAVEAVYEGNPGTIDDFES
jgi:hypothetical protein